ncbi:hypothetical protein ACWDR0_00235 [Streptomyces sp. NPDC003691]
MLFAFALPAVNSGPQEVPIGLAGPRAAVAQAEKALAGDAWDITRYDSAEALASAVEDRDVLGGLALSPEGVTLYRATAAAPGATTALTGAATAAAAQHGTAPTVNELAPFPDDDAKGAGFGAAALPLLFGGILSAAALAFRFPGRPGLRSRLTGAVLFAPVAGFSVTAVLQYATGSLAGSYWLNALGLSLGIAALTLTLLGLESLIGTPGLGLGAAFMMLLANPLSGFATGPHWVPEHWAAFGQLLPPGAVGSLLRATSFSDGTGAGGPALVLACWAVLGLTLLAVAGRRGGRTAAV